MSKPRRSITHRAGRLLIEPIERRMLLAAITWDAGGDGVSWSDSANWSGNGLPTAADDVTIALAESDPQIRLGSGEKAVRNLVTSEDLLLQNGAILRVSGDLTLDNALVSLESASIRFNKPGVAMLGGTGELRFTDNGGAIFVSNSYLDTGRDLTIAAGVQVRVTAGTQAYIVCADSRLGKIVNAGTIEMSAAGGKLNLGMMPSTSVAVNFENEGTIRVQNSATVHIAGTWNSSGSIVVKDANLTLDGRYDTHSVSTVSHIGSGTVSLGGTVDLATGPLVLDDETGSMTLIANSFLQGPGEVMTQGAARLNATGGTLIDVTIRGTFVTQQFAVKTRGAFKLDGTLIGTGGYITPDGGWTLNMEVEDGATFSGASVQGTITIDEPGSTVYFENGFELGTVVLSGAGARAIAIGTQTLRGTFQFDSDATTSLLIRNASPDVPATLTFGGTIYGRNGVVVDDPSNTQLATLINTNRIESDRAGGEVTIALSVFTNSGRVVARNGGIVRILTTPTNYMPETGTLNGGSWIVYADSSLLLPAGVEIVHSAATMIGLSGQSAAFPALTPLASNTGSLYIIAGAEFVAAESFINSGTIWLGATSALNVASDFTQTSNGSLRAELNTDDTGATLQVVGDAHLSGTLTAVAVAPFAPTSSTLIAFLTAASVNGTFSSFSGVVDQNGRLLQPRYLDEAVLISVSSPYPSFPSLRIGDDTGISASDRITNVANPTLVGTAQDATEVRLYLDDVLVGTGPVVNGSYSIATSGLAHGTYVMTVVAVDSDGDASSPTSRNLTVDLVPPTPTTLDFVFDTNLPPHRLRLNFFDRIYYNALLAHLTLENMTTGETIPSSALQIQGENSFSAELRFPTLPGRQLPDGDYRLTVANGAVTDTAGNLSHAAEFSFFVLAGDVNRDRAVNFDDLLILSQNYGQTGRTFSQGNVNYSSDGLVGFDDLLLLAQRYGTSIATMTTATTTSSLKAAAKKRGSVAAEMI